MAILEGSGVAKPVQKTSCIQVTQFKRLCDGAIVPTKSHPTDAGFDLYCIEDVHLQAGEQKLIGTGISVAVPFGTVGLVCPRSGLAAKNGITITNSPGIIDSGYRGELKIILKNTSADEFFCERGSRIAQLVVVPYYGLAVEVDDLQEADRGSKGFGSTGH